MDTWLDCCALPVHYKLCAHVLECNSACWLEAVKLHTYTPCTQDQTKGVRKGRVTVATPRRALASMHTGDFDSGFELFPGGNTLLMCPDLSQTCAEIQSTR